jgi:hypothetical protein
MGSLTGAVSLTADVATHFRSKAVRVRWVTDNDAPAQVT